MIQTRQESHRLQDFCEVSLAVFWVAEDPLHRQLEGVYSSQWATQRWFPDLAPESERLVTVLTLCLSVLKQSVLRSFDRQHESFEGLRTQIVWVLRRE